MDKCTLKFIADILYLKGILCFEELDAIYEIKHPSDLDIVFERMIGGDFNVYKRGEPYTDYAGTGGGK